MSHLPRTPHHLLLSVVLFREHDTWVAAGLEHFVAAQGPTEEKARHALVCSVVAQVLNDLKAQREPLALIPAAPAAYWEQFHEAARGMIATHPIEMPASAPPTYMVEAILH